MTPRCGTPPSSRGSTLPMRRARRTPWLRSRSCSLASHSDSSIRSSAIRSPTTSRRPSGPAVTSRRRGCCTARARNPNVSPLTCSPDGRRGIRGPSSNCGRLPGTLGRSPRLSPPPGTCPAHSRNLRRHRFGRTCSPNSGSPRRPRAARALPSTSSRRLRCVRIRADEQSWRCIVGTRSTRTASIARPRPRTWRGSVTCPTSSRAPPTTSSTTRCRRASWRPDRCCPSCTHARRSASAELLARAERGPHVRTQRQLLAQAAVHAAFAAEPAEVTLGLAERAWADGELIAQDGADGVAWSLVTAAMSWSGALERCDDVLDAVATDASRRALAARARLGELHPRLR